MRSDLDRLLEERNLDALLVMGDSDGNKIMNYLTGGVHLERALIVKRRGGPLTLVHGSMERDTAAETGLTLVDRDVLYNQYELLEKHQGDRVAAAVDYMSQVVRDQGLQGRLGIYGMHDAGGALAVLSELQKELDGTELVGEYEESLFTLARETKDNRELGELQEAARLTCLVVGEVQAYIQSHQVEDDIVVKSDGEALTVGDVKQYMRERLFVHGLNDHGQTIFSVGRDAAVPHNRGSSEVPLRLGHTIIFDIFPQTSSGYYHDMTRTWCLGYAPPDVQEAWDQTKEIFDQVMNSLEVGKSCMDYQLATCEYYENKGHRTPLNHPGAQDGYVHSLGHGIGLDIHEEPALSHRAGNTTVLQPGHVVSVEPGLYYPDRGFGVRIEDSIAFNEAGELVRLTDYPHDLVIAMGDQSK